MGCATCGQRYRGARRGSNSQFKAGGSSKSSSMVTDSVVVAPQPDGGVVASNPAAGQTLDPSTGLQTDGKPIDTKLGDTGLKKVSTEELPPISN